MRWMLLLAAVVLAVGCDGEKKEVRVVLGAEGGVPGTIEQAVQERGPNPTDVIVNLSNAGNCELAWAVETVTVDGAPWLWVSPASGTLAAGGTTPLAVIFDVVAPMLRPGRYTGSLTLTGTCKATGRAAVGSPATVAVNLTVTAVNAELATDKNSVRKDVAPMLVGNWKVVTDGGLTATPTHTALWTGYQVLNFANQAAGDGGYLAIGASYDPLTGRVANLPALPIGRSAGEPSVVWSGTRALAWLNCGPGFEGAAYDPEARQWAAFSADGGVTQRAAHGAVMAGKEMAVWGGNQCGSGQTPPTTLASGALYDPAAGTWRSMTPVGAPAARFHPTLLWTGKDLMVLFGERWTSAGASEPVAEMGLYDPKLDRWRAVSAEGAPPGLRGACAWWTGRRVIVFGGTDASGSSPRHGWSYEPATDTWKQVTNNTYDTRVDAACGWTGLYGLMWGGSGQWAQTSGLAFEDYWNVFTEYGSFSWHPNGPETGPKNASVWTGTHFYVTSPTSTALFY